MISITVENTIDAGHRILGHKGKCARLHGHTYRIQVEAVAKELQGPGFVVDFGDIKDLINQWDHFMLLWDQDPIIQRLQTQDGVVLLPFNPTAENMAAFLADRIFKMAETMVWVQVKVWETPKAYASRERSIGQEI